MSISIDPACAYPYCFAPLATGKGTAAFLCMDGFIPRLLFSPTAEPLDWCDYTKARAAEKRST